MFAQGRGSLNRAFAWVGDRRRATVLVLIVGTALLRIVYAVAVMEPVGSGPDGPSYHEAAVAMVSDGFLSPAPNVPYWPPGYPMLIALVYSVVGVMPRVVAEFQVVAVAGATYMFYRWTEEEFGVAVGMTTLVLLSVSPAFGASQTVFMYEPLLAVCLMVSIPLIAARTGGGRLPTVAALVMACGVLAIGSIIQPKLALAALLLLGWWSWRWRRFGLAVVALSILALGPLLLFARNYIVDGHAVMSANLGTTLELGVGHNLGCAPYDDIYERDRVLTRCAFEWTLDNPGEAAQQAAERAVDYWRPFVGPSRSGTWFHAFDVRRLLPRGALNHSTVRSLDMGLSALWTLVLVGLIGIGSWRAFRISPAMASLVTLPVLAFFAVSVVIIGDARMRLPTAPLYSLLLACNIGVGPSGPAEGSSS